MSNYHRPSPAKPPVDEFVPIFGSHSELPEALSGTEVYWIGPRESDMRDAVDFPFAGSITQFGSGVKTAAYTNYAMCSNVSHPERVDHNDANDLTQNDFVLDAIEQVIQSRGRDKVRLYLYNGNAINFLKSSDGTRRLSDYQDLILCLNDDKWLMEHAAVELEPQDGETASYMMRFNDKTWFHKTFGGISGVELLETEEVGTADCIYSKLAQRLVQDPLAEQAGLRFVVQAPVASGGSGTFVMSNRNEIRIMERLSNDPSQKYLCSIYQERNISANIHAIIFDRDILFTPCSIQLMHEDSDRLMYRGADFVAFHNLSSPVFGIGREAYQSLVETYRAHAMAVCKKLQEMGYRGVCGIDALLYRNNAKSRYNIALLELNNRFQSSTGLVNRALRDCGAGYSIQWLNLLAFTQPAPPAGAKNLLERDLVVPYSNYSYIKNENTCHMRFLAGTPAGTAYIKEHEFDGFDRDVPDMDLRSYAYLFRTVFSTNISWINEDGYVFVSENVKDPTQAQREMIFRDGNWLMLKVALMTQGIVIDRTAQQLLQKLRPATNNAIDLELRLQGGSVLPEDFMVVNVPLNDVRFVELSPFRLCYVDGRFLLQYYEEKIEGLVEVRYYEEDMLQAERVPETGLRFSEVAYLSTDRLRVHLSNQCKYKREGEGCLFCNMGDEHKLEKIETSAIRYVAKEYLLRRESNKLAHFLIGGQTPSDPDQNQAVLDVIDALVELTTYDIYAMITPPSGDAAERTRWLKRYADHGLTEIGMNIELFDEDCARRYMPGKGAIPRDTYRQVLQSATDFFGRDGNVRSMVIIGLEPENTMISGIRWLIRNGIQPILSIFRPLGNTALEALIPPPVEYLVRLYRRLEKECAENGLQLGPACTYCQNNTLAMPYPH